MKCPKIQAVETIKTEYKNATDPSVSLIREIGHGFLSIEFPSEATIGTISTILRSKHQDKVMIVNMSERSYDYDKMPGHVITANFRGLPSPPLDILARLCLQIHQWKSRSPDNIVAIHCFPGYSRTAVLVSCYLAWCGIYYHPVDGLIDVCRGLKIDESESILPSQKRYLNYFFDLLSTGNPPTPPALLFLSRLTLTGIPDNLPLSEDAHFRPFFEIWKDGRMLFSTLPKDVPNEALIEMIPSYQMPTITNPQDIIAPFQLESPVCISGDVLFRIRHLSTNGARITCMRFALNSNYVFDNTLHLSHHEIDGNSFSKCLIDIAFDRPSAGKAVVSDAGEEVLFKRSHDISSKLRQGISVVDDDEVDRVIGLPINMDEPDVPIISIADDEDVPVADDVDDFFAQLEREAKM